MQTKISNVPPSFYATAPSTGFHKPKHEEDHPDLLLGSKYAQVDRPRGSHSSQERVVQTSSASLSEKVVPRHSSAEQPVDQDIVYDDNVPVEGRKTEKRGAPRAGGNVIVVPTVPKHPPVLEPEGSIVPDLMAGVESLGLEVKKAPPCIGMSDGIPFI